MLSQIHNLPNKEPYREHKSFWRFYMPKYITLNVAESLSFIMTLIKNRCFLWYYNKLQDLLEASCCIRIINHPQRCESGSAHTWSLVHRHKTVVWYLVELKRVNFMLIIWVQKGTDDSHRIKGWPKRNPFYLRLL